MKKSEQSQRYLWDTIKHTTVCIMEIPEGEEREKEAEKNFEEKIAENFSNLIKTQIYVSK